MTNRKTLTAVGVARLLWRGLRALRSDAATKAVSMSEMLDDMEMSRVADGEYSNNWIDEEKAQADAGFLGDMADELLTLAAAWKVEQERRAQQDDGTPPGVPVYK